MGRRETAGSAKRGKPLRGGSGNALTDLERAARFLYLQRLGFGGKVNSVFSVAPDHGPRFSLSRLEPILDAAHERLEGVVFETLDWSDLVRRYDGPNTLFYLDPPYFGGEDDYGKDMFSRDPFAAMADQLRGIEGRFILSTNDTPEIREAFAGFIMEKVRLKYTVSSAEAAELIISNVEARVTLISRVLCS